jgi:hypothetical protein
VGPPAFAESIRQGERAFLRLVLQQHFGDERGDLHAGFDRNVCEDEQLIV